MDQSEIENKSGIFFTSSSDVFHFSKLQKSADKMWNSENCPLFGREQQIIQMTIISSVNRPLLISND